MTYAIYDEGTGECIQYGVWDKPQKLEIGFKVVEETPHLMADQLINLVSSTAHKVVDVDKRFKSIPAQHRRYALERLARWQLENGLTPLEVATLMIDFYMLLQEGIIDALDLGQRDGYEAFSMLHDLVND